MNPSPEPRPRRIVVGISGASGTVYGVRVLEALAELGVETHAVVSKSAHRTAAIELGKPLEVDSLASVTHRWHDLGAPISSGSFQTDGMIIAPCSIKTLSGLVNSYDDNLLIRAADVTLKERRRLVILLRETPLHLGHLRLMVQAAEMGAVIAPPVPAFYAHPQSIADLVTHSVGRALDLFGLDYPALSRWPSGG
jgi:4-hydroxy-3-polyprenylbenzoate decarboxylase